MEHDAEDQDLQRVEAPVQQECCPEKGYALTTGDMARLTKSTLRTVRFYEAEGLLRPASREEGGARCFSTEDLERLRLILDLREAGLSLQDIRELFELKTNHSNARGASQQMNALLERQIERMRIKIQTLERLRGELGAMMQTIETCTRCEDARFPAQCGECSVMHQEDTPRCLRLLWGQE